MPRDLPYPGICGILRSSPQWGGAGAGWEFRSQGRAQGPAGNTASQPGQPPGLNSQALWGLLVGGVGAGNCHPSQLRTAVHPEG